MWTVSLPLKVSISKEGVFYLNLNQYRNTHFQILNKAKVNFEEVVAAALKDVPILPGCRLQYTLFVVTKRRCDISNICSIVDKFFSDTLVNLGKIPDDSFDYLPEVNYSFGGIEKDKPRVEVTIHPFTPTNPAI